jgi:subfamily B ATP-binding cassette protein MsbA
MLVALFLYLIAPIAAIVGIGSQLGEIVAGMDRANEMLTQTREHPAPARTVSLGPLRGDVAFEDVRFSYGSTRSVVSDISFAAPAGTVTALVGPSGAGKSTLMNLLAAFYKPAAGRITVDGLDLSTVRLDTYRTQLGLVLQDDFLFAGSVAENISFSRPLATRAELIDAARAAHVDEFVERMADGYDTQIGAQGVQLSRGQRQRIAIARAVLADPRIFILDEATSTLDLESERHVQQALRALMKGRTTFVIAHRLATVRQAALILFIENGKIVERGTHESLLKLRKRYWELHQQQVLIERDLLPASGATAVAGP